MEMKMWVLAFLPTPHPVFSPDALTRSLLIAVCDGDSADGDDADDATNLWVHLCIMGMASTSDSFVFIYFGAQHIRNTTQKTAQTHNKRQTPF